MLEYISNIEKETHFFDDEGGNCIGEHNESTPKPQRMKWEISKEVNTHTHTSCNVHAGTFSQL